MNHEEMARGIDAWNFTARQRSAVLGLIAEYRGLLARLEELHEDVLIVAYGDGSDPPKVKILREAEILRRSWPADRMPCDAVPNPDRKPQSKPRRVDPEVFRRVWLAGGSRTERAEQLGITKRRAVEMAKKQGLPTA